MAYASIPHDDWGDEIFCVVGRIVIAFGQLEHILKLAYKRTTGKKYKEALDFADKLASNKALAKQLSDKFALRAMHQQLEGEMDKIIGRILKVNELRNVLVHGYWHKRFSSGDLLVVKGGRGWPITDKTLGELRKLHGEIVAIRDTLNKFTKR